MQHINFSRNYPVWIIKFSYMRKKNQIEYLAQILHIDTKKDSAVKLFRMFATLGIFLKKPGNYKQHNLKRSNK